MKKIHQVIGLSCCLAFFSLPLFAQAPIIDESSALSWEDERALNEAASSKTEHFESAHSDDSKPLVGEEKGGAELSLLNKMHHLQQELQELRGQLEVQAHQIKVLEQQLESGAPLPKSSAELEPKSASASRPNYAENRATTIQKTSSNASHSNPAEEQISYLAAYDLVKNKHFVEGLAAMEKFVERYPQGSLTANAEYWLGELYLLRNDGTQAMAHFERILTEFSSSAKAPAAALKMGYVLASLGKENEAKTYLEQVVKNYPETTTAQLAATKLSALGFR